MTKEPQLLAETKAECTQLCPVLFQVPELSTHHVEPVQVFTLLVLPQDLEERVEGNPVRVLMSKPNRKVKTA